MPGTIKFKFAVIFDDVDRKAVSINTRKSSIPSSTRHRFRLQMRSNISFRALSARLQMDKELSAFLAI